MIDMAHFDTLTYVETLKTAGVSDTQAKAFARAQQKVITECLETTFPNKLATKSDLTEVKIALRAEIGEVKADVAVLKKDVAALKIDVIGLKADNKLFKWLFGFIISGLIAVFSGVTALVLKTFL